MTYYICRPTGARRSPSGNLSSSPSFTDLVQISLDVQAATAGSPSAVAVIRDRSGSFEECRRARLLPGGGGGFAGSGRLKCRSALGSPDGDQGRRASMSNAGAGEGQNAAHHKEHQGNAQHFRDGIKTIGRSDYWIGSSYSKRGSIDLVLRSGKKRNVTDFFAPCLGTGSPGKRCGFRIRTMY